MIVHADFLTNEWAPPTPSPGETVVTPTTTTTVVTPSMTQLPTTGTSDTATMSVAFGVGLFLLGAVALLAVRMRQRRAQG